MTVSIDLWAGFLKYIGQPLYYSRSGDRRFARLNELERNQWLSPAELEALQLRRINALLRHAFRTTEFYRQRLSACGIGEGPIDSLSDLTELKPVSKYDLQQHYNEMISSIYKKSDLVEDASGGSTGAPTAFYKDLNRHNLRRADQIRHDRWSGWDIGDRWALVWGARKDLIDDSSWKQRIRERYFDRCISLDAFELTEQKMHDYAQQLARFRPKMILGYAKALDRFSQFLLDNKQSGVIKPAGVVSSAECLSNSMRDCIQAAFGCKVLNRYGSREVGLIASDCGRGMGLHINADNLLVEILENGKPATSGEVVVTDFWNYGMPLIRYRMDDRAKHASTACDCGRGLPLLESVDGRSSDFLTAADGTLIHGEFFSHLFYGIDSVSQFQFVQETMNSTVISVVPLHPENRGNLDAVVEGTRRILGNDTQVRLNWCDTIPPTPSGKFRFTISRVNG